MPDEGLLGKNSVLALVATKVAFVRSVLSNTSEPATSVPVRDSWALADVGVVPEVVVTYRCGVVALNCRLNCTTYPLEVAVTLPTASCGSVMLTVAVEGVPRVLVPLGFSRLTVNERVPA